jgi:predicted ATPase
MRTLPSGTVTLLFTDIEGSTRLLQELGAERFNAALGEHRRVLRKAFQAHEGVELRTEGDSFFAAFASARDAVAAAAEALQAFEGSPLRVRIGIHTGEPLRVEHEDGYVGADVHLAARICAAGHGGQVVLSQATRELVAGELTDLGEHRLKDFTQPVWIFQLGSERFPPLKTISNTNLPRPASSFVGREREVADVTALLREGVRLVTLSGPGGSGKTRLAIEAAAELVPEFGNGVFWIGLAPLRDPALVSETIALTLGAKDGLAEHIGERELLLVLDNVEQVVQAASELATLVEVCPNLLLLVTSRELLRVRGEVEYPVLPLAASDAVELFCERASVEQDETIVKLCGRLDNLPLALELAAARTGVLSPRQILDRISQRLDLLRGGRDAEPRQQTLRATIEWSYELLGAEDQRLLARLAVFRGGCTLEAAEAVCDAQVDALQSLAAKNLLRHSSERFWMLETVREFALERLVESDEADPIRRRHAEHFVAVAETADVPIRDGDAGWLEVIDREIDNCRAALVWAKDGGHRDLLQGLVNALGYYWYMRGHLSEGRRWLELALERDGEASPQLVGRMLTMAAGLAEHQGDYEIARRYAEQSLRINRQAGAVDDLIGSLNALAGIAAMEGDLDEARRLIDEALRLAHRDRDEHWILMLTSNIGEIEFRAGRIDEARQAYDEALRRARALNFPFGIVRGATGLGGADLLLGAPDRARPVLAEALKIAVDSGFTELAIGVLRNFAFEAASQNDRARTAQLVGAVERMEQDLGSVIGGGFFGQNRINCVLSELPRSELDQLMLEGRAMELEEAAAYALEPLREA